MAYLARLGNAMMGSKNVPVSYKEQTMSAFDALKQAGLKPFEPKSKEGLALTNGTSFMNAMLCSAFIQEIHMLENVLACSSLFLDSIQAIDAAFYECVSEVRGQWGQFFIAKTFSKLMKHSSFINKTDTQNDYSIRCIPQLYGPKFESILNMKQLIIMEMNAPTDNPLIFKNEQISPDVSLERIIEFNNNKYAIISGGNFHGEILSQSADTIRLCNAKIFITMERQTTFMLNPARNKILPPYLIADTQNAGLKSGFMISQYTCNSLA